MRVYKATSYSNNSPRKSFNDDTTRRGGGEFSWALLPPLTLYFCHVLIKCPIRASRQQFCKLTTASTPRAGPKIYAPRG